MFFFSAQTCSCHNVEVYSKFEGVSFPDDNGNSLFGIYEQQALPSFNRSLYANEDRMIMWTKNNEWIIKSNDKIYAKISKNDTCPDFPYLKDWRVYRHGLWKNDIGLRIKVKSETCTAGMGASTYELEQLIKRCQDVKSSRNKTSFTS